jgi:MoaA/NifB/PqqE/SkfB family radical SAM enzyme
VDAHEAGAFDRTRDIAHQGFRSLCYAPSVSMYFDVRGNVIACCQNTTDVLGNVNDEPLAAIWHGERARRMRRRLLADEFPAGCDFCRWEYEKGSFDGLFATGFDEHHAPGPDPDWPVLMEFALSNRCNLACVMCNGDFSSTIRSRRERRPPLPAQYGERFFDELRPFLPHLRQARFLGGEPFLIPEYQRIWQLMATDGSTATCNVTTNGTIRTAATEATLARLPFSIGVSMDGITPATVEAVRVGADFDVLLANIRWFHAYCADRGTGFGLTYCLMTHNWREFSPFLSFADDLDASVSVNTVVYPAASSLYQLPLPDLEEVIDGLAAIGCRSERNRAIWDLQLARLGDWRDQLVARAGEPGSAPTFFEAWGTYRGPSNGPSNGPSQGPAVPVPVAIRRAPTAEEGDRLDPVAARRRLEALTGLPASTIAVGSDNVIEAVDGPAGRFLGLDLALVGQEFPALVAALEQAWGPVVGTEEHQVGPNAVERVVRLGSAATPVSVRCITVAESPPTDGGQPRSVTVAICDDQPARSSATTLP